MTRRRPNMTERLAAVLLMLKRGESWLIPEPIRSKGTAKEICDSVEWHHTTPFAIVRETKPQALTPLRPDAHAIETRKVTIPMVTKVKRGLRKRRGEKSKPAKKIPSRPFPTKEQKRAWKEQRGLA